MAKVQIKNVKSALMAIETLITSGLRKSQVYQQIGSFSVDRIKAETRKGRDLSKDGNPIQDTDESTKNIKALIEKGTIKMNPARPLFFRSKKSQLTQSGQLLDSLVATINSANGSVTITPEGNHTPPKYTWSKSGEPVKFLSDEKSQSNKGLASDLAKRGFTFLGMDKKGVERIRRIALDEIRRIVRRKR